jgi:EAL domain-containing protein (putative c-di-GMP-specific phosphodiesterase class I)
MQRDERVARRDEGIDLVPGHDLGDDPDVVASILGIIDASGLKGRHVRLEVTESTLLEEPDIAIDILTDLANHGINGVIDDFGTGYSSLSYLSRLPVAALKIDRSFVSALDSGGGAIGIVRSIIAMARELGIDVIAEGVESPTQLRQLKQFDCGEVQGYLFGRPVDAREAEALIAEQAATPDSVWIGSHVESSRSAPNREMAQNLTPGVAS